MSLKGLRVFVNVADMTRSRVGTIQKTNSKCLPPLEVFEEKHLFVTVGYCGWLTMICDVGCIGGIGIVPCVRKQAYQMYRPGDSVLMKLMSNSVVDFQEAQIKM